MVHLFKLDAPSIRPGETYKKIELARWLSNWHLIAFLETTQLISPVSFVRIRYIYSLTLLDLGGREALYENRIIAYTP
jgi:nuclear protein localization family protein 4